MAEKALIGQEIVLHEAVDRAPGAYARVFRCQIRGLSQLSTIKLMRSEHYRIDPADLSNKWYVESFATEAKILAQLAQANAPCLTKLIGCGYINSAKQPVSDLYKPGSGLAKEADAIIEGLADSNAIIYSPEEVDSFSECVDSAYLERRLPFLLLELRNEPTIFDVAQGLFNFGRGLRFPVVEIIDFIYQAGRLLEISHSCNIVYRDFKLAHYHWDGQQLYMIDWNSSAFIDPNISSIQQAKARAKDVRDLVCSLVPLFTGRPYGSLSFFADPSLPFRVETRFENPQPIQWDESDVHIGELLEEWVNRGVRAEFAQVSDLINALHDVEAEEWGTLDGVDDRAMARNFLQLAVVNLRKGQALLHHSPDEVRYFYKESEKNLFDALDVNIYAPGTAPYLE